MSNLKPEGMSYFPFSVDLFEDEALERVRDEFGVVVNSVYVLMLCYLYKKKGYYIPYSTNKEKEDLHWYIYKRVQGGKYKIQLQVLPKVIEALVARELFSRELSPKIITSKRAQETYYRATVDRKAVEINPDYWLLNDVEMRKISQKHPYYLMLHPELKSDEDKAKSVDFEYKSGNFTLKGKEKVNKSNYNSLSSGARTRESTVSPLQRFLERWGVSANAIGNYRGGKMAEIDWAKLSEKVEQSTFLQKQKAISFFIDHYEKILDGAYDDWDDSGGGTSDKRKPLVDTTDPDFDISGLDKIHYD